MKTTPSELSFRPLSFLALLAALLPLSACGKDATTEPETPASAADEPAPAASAGEGDKATDDPTKSDLNISDAIKKACGLTDTEARFSYNSANVRESDKAVLKKLADCFATGPLKGKTMAIVGHADPRGEPEYNMTLGGRRADNVASAIGAAGLAEAQMETTSRGELDARGTDEASWAADRRVDILLAEGE